MNRKPRPVTHIFVNKYKLFLPIKDKTIHIPMIYHSAVQINNDEYSYGYNEHGTGVWRQTPRENPEFCEFVEHIFVGSCNLYPEEIEQIINQMKQEYQGDQYSLISRNCNFFSNDLCKRLCGKGLPSGINAPAQFASKLLGRKTREIFAFESARPPVSAQKSMFTIPPSSSQSLPPSPVPHTPISQPPLHHQQVSAPQSLTSTPHPTTLQFAPPPTQPPPQPQRSASFSDYPSFDDIPLPSF
ncbi:putative deubiquitinase DESI2 [Blattamonas nauphoetae]|uniref:Deubiquitinase DESI2 n=1 Tax=Blattamonas nauphoetae TaxID=2049346 RepID=A0ABQ9YHC0_9EUKA|nr:putative deubiquitinase DESI2 [Blattamonas nauphoetae]